MRDMNTVIEVQVLSPEQESVKNLVLAKMQTLEQIRFQRKKLKEKLDSFLLDDEEYKVTFQKTDNERKKLRLIKERLNQNPEIYQIRDELKELNRTYNETKQDISDFLVTFQSMTGQLSFIDPTGREVQIVRSASPKIIKVDFKEKIRRGR